MQKKTNNKMSIDEIISKFTCVPHPVIREYLMLHFKPFFESFKALANETLDAESAQHYAECADALCKLMQEQNENDIPATNADKKERVYIRDVIRACELSRKDKYARAVLNAVFIYPFNIINAGRVKTKTVEPTCYDDNQVDELEDILASSDFKDTMPTKSDVDLPFK